MNFYQKILKKYSTKKFDTKCAEFLEILNKLEFYKKRTTPYLKPVYEILCLIITFLLKKENERNI